MPMIQETPELQREFERAWKQARQEHLGDLDAPMLGLSEWARSRLIAGYTKAWDAAFPGIPCLVQCGTSRGIAFWCVGVAPANESARNRLLELLDARIEARKQARREEALEEMCAYV
jgi:hypothetical protein